MKKLLHRVWAEIDLDALDNNIELVKKAAPGKEIIAVVKANAYGHDVGIVVPELFRCGVKHFAVSNIEEALTVRKIQPEAEILIFGYGDAEWFGELVRSNLIQTVGDVGFARELSAFAEKNNKTVRVHIKVNSGMTRVGIDTSEELDEIMKLKGLNVEGVYTHFACSDSLDREDFEYTVEQERKLREIAAAAEKKGIPVYSQNSGGILYHSDFVGEFVRSGIITYGCMPNVKEAMPEGYRPVLTLKARVCQIKKIPAGVSVSYGRTYTTEHEITAAIVPVGYADGYSRALSNCGAVYINGKRCPICGRVCMDQIIVDVTGQDVSVGDLAVLYSDTIPEIMVDNIAEKLGTIGYELLCCVGTRVQRVAVRGGEFIG